MVSLKGNSRFGNSTVGDDSVAVGSCFVTNMFWSDSCFVTQTVGADCSSRPKFPDETALSVLDGQRKEGLSMAL